MRSIIRPAIISRLSTSCNTATSVREYHGDPGPSTIRRSAQSNYGASSTPGNAPRSPPFHPGSRGPKDSDTYYPPAVPSRFRPSDTSFKSQRNPRTRPPSPNGRIIRSNRPQPRATKPTNTLTPKDVSREIKAWMTKNKPPLGKAMRAAQIEEGIQLLIDTPREAVNAVVFNQMLAMIGREGRMERMWRFFNDMKKRGITPNSRTYTTMINAYAGVNHAGSMAIYNPYNKPDPRTMQRIVGIYNESQRHISEQVAKLVKLQSPTSGSAASDLGLSGKVSLQEEKDDTSPSPDMSETKAEIEQDISLGPSNAYLKLLNRYGLWNQMERIHLAMDQTGPLAPNSITYSTLFSGLLNQIAEQTEKRYTPALQTGQIATRLPLRVEDIGAKARSLWDGAIRQFYKDGNTPPDGSERRVDEEMGLLAMQALLKGRPADERLAVALIPFLWNLPSLQAVNVATTLTPATLTPLGRGAGDEIPQFMRRIPSIPISICSASSIVTMLSKASKHGPASLYAQHFLSLPTLSQHIDYPFLRTVIHTLSNTRDIHPIIDILDTYQPPTGPHSWPEYVYSNALTAARWSSDFTSAMKIFRRYTHLPLGVEDGLPPNNWVKYNWVFPNGKPTDVMGNKWIKPLTQRPSPKMMGLLCKTAVSGRNPGMVEGNVKKFWNVFSGYRMDEFFVISKEEMGGGGLRDEEEGEAEMRRKVDMRVEGLGLGMRGLRVDGYLVKALEWRVGLARDLVGVCERLEEMGEGEEGGDVLGVKRVMEGIVRRWSGDRRFREVERSPTLEAEEKEWSLEID